MNGFVNWINWIIGKIWLKRMIRSWIWNIGFSVHASHFYLFHKEASVCFLMLDSFIGIEWDEHDVVTASEPIPNLFFIPVITLNSSGLHCFYQMYKLRLACFYWLYFWGSIWTVAKGPEQKESHWYSHHTHAVTGPKRGVLLWFHGSLPFVVL